MLKIIFLTTIVGTTIWTSQANKTEENKRIEEIRQELYDYVTLDGWQQLFSRHFKFIVNDNGEVISERHRLKFNTIIHNALYGCDHKRDDEVDDCPNISRGSIKTYKQGLNLRSAMFRAARCVFAEYSIKHVVLSDALLEAYPTDKLNKITDYADKPIREFGETLSNMLSVLVHGEIGGLGELMALNLYLNNKFNTVFIYKIPVEPVTTLTDFEIAQKHMRSEHNMILDKLYSFWDTWCSDRDVVTQYRHKYRNEKFIVVLDEMNMNIEDAEALVRGLNVSDNVVDLDLDPKRIALTDYVNGLISKSSMPAEILTDIQLRAFEASYEFNPREIYEYHKYVFRNIYTCYYWTTITHLKLGVRMIDEMKKTGVNDYRMSFRANFIKYVKPLVVFNINQREFVSRMAPKAMRNLNKLISFLSTFCQELKDNNLKKLILKSRPKVQKLTNALTIDMEKMLNFKMPVDNVDELSYEDALKVMRSNYNAFARLVSATSDFKEDRMNLLKLKKTLFFLSEAVPFNVV